MRNYIPYFESAYNSIIPFEQVSFINEIREVASSDRYSCTIIAINGSKMTCFTFQSLEDMKNQLKNYKEYLITKSNKKELV